jgi:hypothetical protein
MSAGPPKIGTRFKYHSTHEKWSQIALYPRRVGVDWEGIVMRVYDIWAGMGSIDIYRLDIGCRQEVAIWRWEILVNEHEVSMDRITILSGSTA